MISGWQARTSVPARSAFRARHPSLHVDTWSRSHSLASHRRADPQRLAAGWPPAHRTSQWAARRAAILKRSSAMENVPCASNIGHADAHTARSREHGGVARAWRVPPGQTMGTPSLGGARVAAHGKRCDARAGGRAQRALRQHTHQFRGSQTSHDVVARSAPRPSRVSCERAPSCTSERRHCRGCLGLEDTRWHRGRAASEWGHLRQSTHWRGGSGNGGWRRSERDG